MPKTGRKHRLYWVIERTDADVDALIGHYLIPKQCPDLSYMSKTKCIVDINDIDKVVLHIDLSSKHSFIFATKFSAV